MFDYFGKTLSQVHLRVGIKSPTDTKPVSPLDGWSFKVLASCAPSHPNGIDVTVSLELEEPLSIIDIGYYDVVIYYGKKSPIRKRLDSKMTLIHVPAKSCQISFEKLEKCQSPQVEITKDAEAGPTEIQRISRRSPRGRVWKYPSGRIASGF